MKTKNAIRNATEEVRATPILGLMTAQPGGIEASESRGQAELVRSEVLPKEMSTEDRVALKSFGIIFGDSVDGDDLFVHAKLPAGWTKRGTDHAMHSDLLDERGRVRASIFYKAAFYDRRANLSVTRRFTIDDDYSEVNRGRREGESRSFVKDAGVVVFDTGWHPRPEGKQWENATRALAGAWIAERRPEWTSVMAYWAEQ